MKVFMISRGIPTPEYPMNGIFEMDYAKALSKRGVDVVFLSIDLRSIRRKRRLGSYFQVIDNISVYSLDLPVGNIPAPLFYPIGVWGLDRLFRLARSQEGTPDVLHAHFTDYGYFAAKIGKKYGIPTVMNEGNSRINTDPIPERLRKIATYAYENVDQLISVSPTFQNRLKEVFDQESTVIPNIFDFENLKVPHRVEHAKPITIVSTGSLREHKGAMDLITAFMQAFPNRSDVSLKIFGEGPQRPELEKVLEEKGERRIQLMGMQPREIIFKAYADADFFVLASHGETFGLAYLEVLALGLPVIATRCGGPETMIQPDNGILVPVKDVNALAHALVDMTASYADYNPTRISEDIRHRFSPDQIIHQLLDVYQLAIDKVRRA